MHTTIPHQRLAKLAVWIHDRLSTRPPLLIGFELPQQTWKHADRELRLWELAMRRRWPAAERWLAAGLQSSLGRLQTEMRQLLDRFALLAAPLAIASAHDIYHDLAACYDEFDEVAWSKRRGHVAVTTAPITLEGRYLGPFRVELDLRNFSGHPTYTVTALDPQPASTNSDVTHPHVQSRRLCEGEGTLAIRAAARDGRLLDFFLIVRNLLETYNSSSPFVSLDDWESSRCSECDYAISTDDEYCCSQCASNLCSECVRHCTDCSESLCASCSLDCQQCHDNLCRTCAQVCIDCDQSFCSSCLSDNERCASCHEEFLHKAAQTARCPRASAAV